MIEKKFNKGDVIFREGDDANSFFQIQEGNVEIIINYGNEDE